MSGKKENRVVTFILGIAITAVIGSMLLAVPRGNSRKNNEGESFKSAHWMARPILQNN